MCAERRSQRDREAERPTARPAGEWAREPAGQEAHKSAKEIGAFALRCIEELTTKQPVGVTAVEPDDDRWVVDVEVLEERRIPSSSDMLALYEVELDAAGDLISYRRTRRYVRGSALGGSEAS